MTPHYPISGGQKGCSLGLDEGTVLCLLLAVQIGEAPG